VAADGCWPRKFKYGTVCVCNSTHCDRTPEPEPLAAGKYALYVSSNAGSRLTRTGDGSFAPSLDSQWVGQEIDVDEATTYQTIRGFGGAFTDSVGINVKSLSPNAQLNLLRYRGLSSTAFFSKIII
jgi:glucosylceramidase